MIAALIRWSVHNRLLVLLAALLLTGWGAFALQKTPLDAIPDLSDTQVIVRTPWPGQSVQTVENQITYPLTTTLLSVPGVKTVRGYSFFGDSFVYVLFDDKTDLYWARSRVLEYLNQVTARLPPGVTPQLGPDATGVGWIFEYALVDKTGQHDISELRALQDWFLKFELKTIPDVAEVASLGGMVKQYQVQVDPEKLRTYRLPLSAVTRAIQAANNENGASVLELAEAEYMVRLPGYLQTLDDFRAISLGVSENGTPITLADVAHIQIGPESRRGIAELNGEGEVAGGVIIIRQGQNALTVIKAVQQKLDTLKASLPAGVEIVTTYDRSQLILRAVENLWHKLAEEFVVVALVCLVFLWHVRSSLVAIITLPLGILAAFIAMYYQGIPANIMSLGGIAIAIGAMVDAAIVMIENAHKHLEQFHHIYQREPDRGEHLLLIQQAASEVGPALFFSLLIITLSFIPVFTLEAQEGKLFSPLAATKTWAMAAAAGLSVTLVPVLMTFFIRGKIKSEQDNALNRGLIALYKPLLLRALQHPRKVICVALFMVAISFWPLAKLGTEFMPPLDEGDLLYMPTALPGLSAAKASEILQLTDRLIKTVPEVDTVFGKAGRAETATDPAPMEMLETTVRLKPHEQWRDGMTTDKIIHELNEKLQIPGMANVWVQPIRNRIDMLATGIKSPVGIKIAGPDLATLEKIGIDVEQRVKQLPHTRSAISERAQGGRYIDIAVKREQAARYGWNVGDVQEIAAQAIGGMNIGEKVEGRARFPINVRFPRELRDSITDLRALPLVTPQGSSVTLDTVADITIADGPAMIKSENARPNVWVYVDIEGQDIGSWVSNAQKTLAQDLQLPAGYSLSWSGQFEFYQRAMQKLTWVVPAVIVIIFILLFVIFKRASSALLILGTIPFALTGAVWLLYALQQHFSIASAIGFIALAGLAAEFGVVMLIYLDNAIQLRAQNGQLNTRQDLLDALIEGAVLRVRPKAMTVAVILAGLLPILIGTGTGSETMARIAAPMVGGMLTAPLLSLFVLPVIYALFYKCDSKLEASAL
ncbi:MAG TPA: efflux RND transporter permease subunit [Pseudomonadales bacterium]|nr:efflux RND transporter permease subunit [Pseudomonadales bacterium]